MSRKPVIIPPNTTFGRLTVTDTPPKFMTRGKGNGEYYYECKCSCGTIERYSSNHLRHSNHTRSCGCLRKDAVRMRNLRRKPNLTKAERTYIAKIQQELL